MDLDKPHADRIRELARLTKEAGASVTPTMALWRTIFGRDTAETLRARRPEIAFMPPQAFAGWAAQREDQLAQIPEEDGRAVLEFRDAMLKALADAGVRILLGSDAPQLFSVPGFSLQREMEAMVRAGLTPYQVLRSGTRDAAEYLDAGWEFGTVEVGRSADLILVAGNPLADVANIARRDGVMLRGRWLPQGDLAKRFAEVAANAGRL